MNAFAGFVRVLHWLGLVLWSGALMSAGIAAMNVFPTLDRLPLRLDAYPDYPVEAHPRLVAGHVMEGVFFTADLLQFVAVPLVVITLAGQLFARWVPRTSVATLVRAAAIAVAAGLFTYHATALAPPMNRALRAYWQAAAAGDVEEAAARRAEFNAYHPRADAILRADLLLVLVAVVGAGAAGSPPRPGSRSSALAPPALLDRR